MHLVVPVPLADVPAPAINALGGGRTRWQRGHGNDAAAAPPAEADMMMVAMQLTLNLLDAMTAQEVGGRGDGLLRDTRYLVVHGRGGRTQLREWRTQRRPSPPASRQGI